MDASEAAREWVNGAPGWGVQAVLLAGTSVVELMAPRLVVLYGERGSDMGPILLRCLCETCGRSVARASGRATEWTPRLAEEWRDMLGERCADCVEEERP